MSQSTLYLHKTHTTHHQTMSPHTQIQKQKTQTQVGALDAGQHQQLHSYLDMYNLSTKVVLHPEALHASNGTLLVNTKGVCRYVWCCVMLCGAVCCLLHVRVCVCERVCV